eukprot:1823090-Pleurochrysis_carterae.AAC.1
MVSSTVIHQATRLLRHFYLPPRLVRYLSWVRSARRLVQKRYPVHLIITLKKEDSRRQAHFGLSSCVRRIAVHYTATVAVPEPTGRAGSNPLTRRHVQLHLRSGVCGVPFGNYA